MAPAAWDEDKNQWAGGPAIADLVAASGAADGTIADVGAVFNQATLNNNFKDLATKVNEILAALRDQARIAAD